MGGRYDLTDFEWSVIEPLLPNKPRGVQRVNDRRVLNGIFWVLRSGAPWRDLPERYGPYTTCYNRFVRWRKAGVWDGIMDTVSRAFDGDIQMIDSSVVRVHQHATNVIKRPSSLYEPLARRTDHQSSRAHRCPRAPDQAGAHPRPDPRRQWRGHAVERSYGWARRRTFPTGLTASIVTASPRFSKKSATASNASSTGSSTSGVLPRASKNMPPTTSP